MKYGLNEDLAIAFSHYIFRNTEIEDFHSHSKKMNFEFYVETIAYCGQFVNHIVRNKTTFIIRNIIYRKENCSRNYIIFTKIIDCNRIGSIM